MNESNARKLHCPNCKSYNISVVDKDFWVCDDCKRKFRDIQEFEEEINNHKNQPMICWISGGFASFLTFLFFYLAWEPRYPEDAFIVAAVPFVPAVLFIIGGFVNKRNLEKMKKELEYLKENCFN